ncbi:hypothetical protein B566_EDAN018453 [Ephemera danica]|nr:hypothetical protein B566_EDAN018453 [Ephemera danica]
MRIVVLETLAESLLLSEYLAKLYTATGDSRCNRYLPATVEIFDDL